MNEIINKLLLAADKFMPEMHLKQPGFNYSACRPFTKTRIQKFKETGDQTIFTKMNLIRLIFNMTWLMEILKIQQEKQLLIKSQEIKRLILQKLLQTALNYYKLFDKKSADSGVNMHANKYVFNNEILAAELHKPIIKQF